MKEEYASLDDICYIQVRATVTTQVMAGDPRGPEATEDSEYVFRLGTINKSHVMPLVEMPDGLFEGNKPSFLAAVLPDPTGKVPSEFANLYRTEDFLKKLSDPTVPRHTFLNSQNYTGY